MENHSKVGAALAEVGMMIFLFGTMTSGPVASIFGAGAGVLCSIVIAVSVVMMCGYILSVSLFAPEKRRQWLREAQGHIFKYLSRLVYLQILVLCMGYGIGAVAFQAFQGMEVFAKGAFFAMYLSAVLFHPYTYISNHISELKAADMRHPKDVLMEYKMW